jgi:type I restriction enzyme M protein
MAVIGGDLGFEASLFKAADKLRGSMEPSDYKLVALGLIFLRHISGSFEAKRQSLLDEYPEGAEDPDAYLAENVFWVPQEARWSHLPANAKQPSIATQWLWTYNNDCPNMGIGGITPAMKLKMAA